MKTIIAYRFLQAVVIYIGFGLGCMIGDGQDGLDAFNRGGLLEVIFGTVPVWLHYAVVLIVCIGSGIAVQIRFGRK